MSTVLVTGANRGIGLELCRQLADRGEHVIAVCRQATESLEALDVELIDSIDVASAADVAKLASRLQDRRIDVLINNAGILYPDTLEQIDFDGMLQQYKVNALGPLRVTLALMNNLHSGAKVAIVTSRVGSIADNESGNNYGYRASKTAVNMIGTNLKHDLGKRGIFVVLLHPGLVATDMTHGNGILPATSATGLIERIDQLNADTNGQFLHAEGYPLPW